MLHIFSLFCCYTMSRAAPRKEVITGHYSPWLMTGCLVTFQKCELIEKGVLRSRSEIPMVTPSPHHMTALQVLGSMTTFTAVCGVLCSYALMEQWFGWKPALPVLGKIVHSNHGALLTTTMFVEQYWKKNHKIGLDMGVDQFYNWYDLWQ